MDYIWKQIWSMKWVTLFVSGLMTAYAINSGSWIPFLQLDIVSWSAAVIGYCIAQWSISREFIALERLRAEGDPVKEYLKVNRGIQYKAWYLWSLGIILVHWAMLVLYVTLTS